MVHAPEVTDYIKQKSAKLDAVSDKVDDVNVLKLKQLEYDDASKFDAAKDKENFRRYEEACDRVKNFYAVSLTWFPSRCQVFSLHPGRATTGRYSLPPPDKTSRYPEKC